MLIEALLAKPPIPPFRRCIDKKPVGQHNFSLKEALLTSMMSLLKLQSRLQGELYPRRCTGHDVVFGLSRHFMAWVPSILISNRAKPTTTILTDKLLADGN